MMVHDLDLFWSLIAPAEYNSPLIVYSDRMLSGEVPSQCLQAVPRQRNEVTERCGVLRGASLRRAALAVSVGNPLERVAAGESARRACRTPPHQARAELIGRPLGSAALVAAI